MDLYNQSYLLSQKWTGVREWILRINTPIGWSVEGQAALVEATKKVGGIVGLMAGHTAEGGALGFIIFNVSLADLEDVDDESEAAKNIAWRGMRAIANLIEQSDRIDLELFTKFVNTREIESESFREEFSSSNPYPGGSTD